MSAFNRMPFVLRDFEKNRNDYSGVAQVVTAVWPDESTTADELELADNDRRPGRISGRVVAEIDGRIIGFGVYGQPEASLRPGEFYLNVLVLDEHRRQGVGEAIYSRIIGRLSRHRLAVLMADTRESQSDAPGFLERRGFEVVQRRPVLRLDVESFDRARRLSARVQREVQNITVCALSELMKEVPDWKRRCWDLDWQILQDIPSLEAPARPTLESYSRCYEDSAFAPQSWFIALQGDEWVGMSILQTDSSTPGTFHTEVTGVRRGFRRRGIATALKLRGIEYVRALGGRVIETDNEESSPMLRLNLTLGFVPGPAILEFRKPF
ncbi:MAG: GNAT family N-acetyltransferase [Kiloniellales bacterium]|nr:GNAT family N-acetyltransferase [Kiloniellales bacterium]